MNFDKIVLAGSAIKEPDLLPRLDYVQVLANRRWATNANRADRQHLSDVEDASHAAQLRNSLDEWDDDEVGDDEVGDDEVGDDELDDDAVLESNSGYAAATGVPHVHRRPLVLEDASGIPQELELTTSPFEWAYNRPANLRFRRHVDVVHVATGARVARQSHGHSLAWCAVHRRRRTPPATRCGTCSTPNDTWRDCRACVCAAHDACAQCLLAHATTPSLRVEVTGKGCTLGLQSALTATLFWTFVDPDTARLNEVHLALDVCAPAELLLAVFRKTKSWRQTGSQNRRAFRSVFNDRAVRGLYHGAGPVQLVTYDKLAELEHRERVEGKRAIVPKHIAGAAACTRIELRVRPSVLLPQANVFEQLWHAVGIWNDVALVDLQKFDPNTVVGMLAHFARFYGHAGGAPTAGSVWAAKEVDFATNVAHRVAEYLNNKSDALRLARAVHAETTRIVNDPRVHAAIDPGHVVAERLPDLEREVFGLAAEPTGPKRGLILF